MNNELLKELMGNRDFFDNILKEKLENFKYSLKKDLEKKEDLDRLRNGDFSFAHVDFWINNENYEYIYAAIEGCDKLAREFKGVKINKVSDYDPYKSISPGYDMLYCLANIVVGLYNNPSIEKVYPKNRTEDLRNLIKESGSYPGNINNMEYNDLVKYQTWVIQQCWEKVLKYIILVASKHDMYYTIFSKFLKSENDKVRLYACCYAPNTINLLDDKNERVRKVAKIKREFDIEYYGMDENKARMINFLSTALDLGAISCYDGLIGNDNGICVKFDSNFFDESNWIYDFDEDIFRNISNKRVLANEILKEVKKGNIKLNYDLLPEYFSEDKTLKK